MVCHVTLNLKVSLYMYYKIFYVNPVRGLQSIETGPERLYETIPGGISHLPAPLHITRLDLDADKIMTKPNMVYGAQMNVSDEQDDGDEMSYCEAYRQLQGACPEDQEEYS